MAKPWILNLTDRGKRYSLFAAAIGVLSANLAGGEDVVPAGRNSQDQLFQQVDYRLIRAEGPGEDTQAPPPDVAPEVTPEQAEEMSTVPTHVPTEGAIEQAEEEPWTFIGLHTDACGANPWTDNGWVFGGWTQFGYQSGPDASFNGNGFAVNQKEWDKFNLNQQWLFLGRNADGSKGFDFGFRVDVIYGVDGNDTQAFGNNPGRYDFQNGFDHGIYEWALPQTYMEVAMGNTTVKIGHFFTLLGYEVVPSNGNFFLSRQMTFYNSEPFTHTGVLAITKVNDKLTVHNGWVLGMDTGWDQFNQSNAYHGGFIYQIAENTSLTYMIVGGNLGWRGDGSINSVILSHAWTDKLTSVHQFDVLNSNLVNANGQRVSLQADGIAGDSIGQINYLFYQFNDKIRAGVREEWYKADGVSYYEVTYGVNVFPIKNLVIRPEVRHMWSNDHAAYGPFNEELFNQTVFGIDAILTY